jgi:hypothetical protein
MYSIRDGRARTQVQHPDRSRHGTGDEEPSILDVDVHMVETTWSPGQRDLLDSTRCRLLTVLRAVVAANTRSFARRQGACGGQSLT